MAGYSLTVVRPQRIGRLTPPSDGALRAAQAQESALTQGMSQPGANQMIGYRFAAEQQRLDEARDYDLAVQQHSDTLGAMREEDRRRALEDQAAQRQHATRMAVINNPAGASAAADEEIRRLLRPESIQQFDDLRRSQIEENNRTGLPRTGGRVPDNGEVRPRDQVRIDEQHNRGVETRIQQERNALRTEEGRIRQTVFGIAAQEQAIAAARQRAAARIAELEGQRRRPGAPQATPQGGGQATPQTGAGGATPQPQAAPTVNRQALIDNARRHLANPNITPQQREAIRQRLQQNGVNPDTLQ